jgi:hypothetical protein
VFAAILIAPFAVAPVLATCNNQAVTQSICNSQDTSTWTDLDIGDCTCAAGSGSYDSGSCTFTVTSTGDTISGTADQFNWVYRQISGDFDFTARLVTLGSPGTREASAGLMVRQNLLPGSRQIWLEYNNHPVAPDPTEPFARLWWRIWNDDKTDQTVGYPTQFTSGSCDCTQTGCCGLPQYQRLIRLGDQISGYWSSDGSTWNRVEGGTLTDLPSSPVPVYIGMAVRSNNADCGPMTATWDHVSIGAPSFPFQTFWFGNSLPGGSTHIQQDITALYVDRGLNEDPRTGQMVNEPRLYTNSIWDEGYTEAVIMDHNGKVLRALEDTHASGTRLGGYAITRNSANIFMGMVELNAGANGTDDRYAVRRYDLKGKKVAWAPDGMGVHHGQGADETLLVVAETTAPGFDLRGLAASSTELYVSDTGNNKVRVYDPVDGHEIRAPGFTVTRPGAIAYDGSGFLWIVQRKLGATNGKVLKYTTTGTKKPTEITSVIDPTAVTVAPDGKIWVADDGQANQQIRIFSASNGNLSGTLGVAQGIYSGTKGQVLENKLNGPIGIGLDSSSNVYVACDPPIVNTGTEIRKFDNTAEHHQVWAKYGIEFVDGADADPLNDGASVFTKQTRYAMNYTQNPGQSWSYAAMTLDRFTYPEDSRLHDDVVDSTGVYVRKSDTTRFLFVGGTFGRTLAIYRFAAGSEIAIPSGLFSREHLIVDPSWPRNQPATGSWIWRNVNGDTTVGMNYMMDKDDPNTGVVNENEYFADGAELTQLGHYYVDDNLDIWRVNEMPPSGVLPIKRYKFKGIDSQGNPKYYPSNATTNCLPDSSCCPDGACVETYEKPAEFGVGCPGDCDTQVQRLVYVPATHTMYLSGFTTARPRANNQGCRLEFGLVGTEIIRYDDWEGSRTLRWRINDLPYPATELPCPTQPGVDYSPYWSVAKGLDVQDTRVFVGIQDSAKVRVYSAANGNHLSASAREPGPEVAGRSSWLDHPMCLSAFRKADCEYVIYAEEDLFAKGIYYELPSSQNCGLCPLQYCTGFGVGCTNTGNCGACGCCNFLCGQSIPSCNGPEIPPANQCP